MVPILINTAEPMTNIKVVTVKDSSEKTLNTLQKIGAIHIEESHELQPVDRASIEREHREVNELYTYINKVLGYLPSDEMITLDEDTEVIFTLPFSEISGEVKQIYNRTIKLQEKIEKIVEEETSLQQSVKYLEPLAAASDLTLKDIHYTGRYLMSRVIIVASESYEDCKKALKDILSENIVTTVENETVLHVIVDARDREKFETVLNTFGGLIIEVPDETIGLKEYVSSGSARLATLNEEKDKLSAELNELIGEDLKKLVLLREALNAENERLSVLEKASEAKYITVFEGWIPDNRVEDTSTDIKEAIDYTFISTRKPEEGEEPPTEYRNPKGFKPFQIVVNLFATPKYREWDPTPIITYSFAFFFGLMVCDVLYAIGLALLARFALPKFVDDPTTENFSQFKKLLYTCAGVALVGGLLTGQYFGNIYEFIGIENLALVKSVQEALQDPVTFIVIALGIGFIHVNIGHILALVKAIKEKDTGNILGKVGIFLLQFGVPTILHGMMGVNIPGFSENIYSILMYVMYAGIIFIIIANVMMSKGLGAILWLFDITGLLGDIMSYARLAGVGLATYYLAFTFNMMAEIFTDLMGGGFGAVIGFILAVFVVAFGHIINLVLTAITGFMHSLRLCFVEFLFKFYEGGGTEYSPFRIKKRKNIQIAVKS